MPMLPKRMKFRKQMRGRLRGNATRGNYVAYGEFGLQSLEPKWVTARQIEAGRIAAQHFLRRQGKIYIAQPPLYQITRGKKQNYVIDEQEMTSHLLDLALAHSELVVRDDAGAESNRLAGDDLQRIVRRLTRLVELVEISGRRGILFEDLLQARDADPEGQGRLPQWRVTWTGGDQLCWNEAEARAFAQSESLVLDEVIATNGTSPLSIASLRELHENAEIYRIAGELAEFGIRLQDWHCIQEETVSGEKLPTRYAWVSDIGTDKESAHDVASVPDIVSTLRLIGRGNIEVKRFKGLGEMNPEELWETTMDPDARTMRMVTLDAASEADRLFSILMGEDVQQRRTYIEDHALEVTNLDV